MSSFDDRWSHFRGSNEHIFISDKQVAKKFWNAALEELEDSIPDMGPDSIGTELSNVYKNISDLYE